MVKEGWGGWGAMWKGCVKHTMMEQGSIHYSQNMKIDEKRSDEMR